MPLEQGVQCVAQPLALLGFCRGAQRSRELGVVENGAWKAHRLLASKEVGEELGFGEECILAARPRLRGAVVNLARLKRDHLARLDVPQAPAAPNLYGAM